MLLNQLGAFGCGSHDRWQRHAWESLDCCSIWSQGSLCFLLLSGEMWAVIVALLVPRPGHIHVSLRKYPRYKEPRSDTEFRWPFGKFSLVVFPHEKKVSRQVGGSMWLISIAVVAICT
jgi:hypothetical protein